MKKNHRRGLHGRTARTLLTGAYDLIQRQKLDCIPRPRLLELASIDGKPLEAFHLRRCLACNMTVATEKVALAARAETDMRRPVTATSADVQCLDAVIPPDQFIDTLLGAIDAGNRLNAGKSEMTLAEAWPLMNDLKKKCPEPAARLDRVTQRRLAVRYAQLVRMSPNALKIVLIYALGSIQRTMAFAAPVVREIAAIDDPLVRRVLAVTLRTEAPHLTKVLDSRCWTALDDVALAQDGIVAFERFRMLLIPPHSRDDGLTELFRIVDAMANALFSERQVEIALLNLMVFRQFLGEVTRYAHATFQGEIIDALSEVRKRVAQLAFYHRAAEFLTVEVCAKTWKINEAETRTEREAGYDEADNGRQKRQAEKARSSAADSVVC